MIGLVIVFAHTTGVQAQSKEELAKCAAISGGIDRLTCFDAITKALNVDTPKVDSLENKGKWLVNSEQSPIDDSKNVFLTLSANAPIPGRYGKNPTPTLVFRCMEKRTEGYINFGVYLGMGTTAVTLRLDKDKAQTNQWGISNDHEAAFIPQPILFLKALTKKETLLVQVTPYGGNPVMMTFDVEDLIQAVKPLSEACNWK